MAIDSKLKRMSAINSGCPWRGPMVDASAAGFFQDSRRAAVFLYSGLLFPLDVPCPYRPRRIDESGTRRPRNDESTAGGRRLRNDESGTRRPRRDECT
jgi:hypothetical protein